MSLHSYVIEVLHRHAALPALEEWLDEVRADPPPAERRTGQRQLGRGGPAGHRRRVSAKLFVVDASVVVEALRGSHRGDAVAARMRGATASPSPLDTYPGCTEPLG